MSHKTNHDFFFKIIMCLISPCKKKQQQQKNTLIHLLLSPIDWPAPVLTPPSLKLLVVWGGGRGVAAVDGMSPPVHQKMWTQLIVNKQDVSAWRQVTLTNNSKD